MKTDSPVISNSGLAIYPEHFHSYKGMGIRFTQKLGTNFIYSFIHSLFQHLQKSHMLPGSIDYIDAGGWGFKVIMKWDLHINEGGLSV